MDLSSSHPRVMLVAQPFAVQLRITHLPQTLPIALGGEYNLGRLACRPSATAFTHPTSANDPFILAASQHGENEFIIEELFEDKEPKKTQFFQRIMMDMTPQSRSILYMALSMAAHFGGYEFCRSATLALFTSQTTGFSTPAAFPLAMAMVTPLALVFLMGYTRDLEQNGPRLALRHSTVASMIFIATTGIILKFLEWSPILLFDKIPLSRLVVGLAFLFQNAYAHLLYQQQWSFIVSVTDEGTNWFSSIAGLSSIAAACAGTIVSQLATRIDLSGLLLCTSGALGVSMMAAERAYSISQEYGFDPADEITLKQKEKGAKKEETQRNLAARGKQLFERVPTLKALFCEVLAFQSLSTILNVCFVTKLKNTIVCDVARASYTGKLYSLVNILSALLQFVILPMTMKRIDTRLIWRAMPLIPVFCSIYQSLQPNASLALLAFSFCAAKCMDYSFRSVANEMVYVPLDFESRYVGKEIIGVFGNRFGKSGMSLFLSLLTYTFGNFGIHQLSILSLLASTTWMSASWWLSGLVPSQAETQDIVNERRKKDS